MFAILGMRIILIEKRPRLLEFADQEIIEALSYHLRDHRVTMRLNEEVGQRVEEAADGSVIANLEERQARRRRSPSSTPSAGQGGVDDECPQLPSPSSCRLPCPGRPR